MKTDRYKAFTLMEIITVIVIITLLLGIMMPALSQVKKYAMEVKQKAQIISIGIGIERYRQDTTNGEYPPSHGDNAPTLTTAADIPFSYCGAQTLAEAMFGQDLIGFHQESIYRNEGADNPSLANADKLYIYSTMPEPNKTASLNKRKEPYLDRSNVGIFTPGQIFDKDTYSPRLVVSDRYVICDVYTAVSRRINGKTYKVGTPVLYFRANPSSTILPSSTSTTPPDSDPEGHKDYTYNFMDNWGLVACKRVIDPNGKDHPFMTPLTGDTFYGYIGDPMILNINRPVRPESFLLISAGADGLYGTKDDICNFDPNLPS
jgi:type II secretory pathway pseudopilin PulG